MHSIETSRLQLRLPQASDMHAMMEIHQDPEAARNITIAAPLGDLTVAWRNIAMLIGHWHILGYGHWSIVEKASGEVIGRVGLWNPHGWPGIELGWIIRRSRWRLGFATEAAQAALHWSWAHVDTDRIISLIQPGHTPSIRVAEKIGARFEGEGTLFGGPVHVYAARRPTGTPTA